MLESLVVAAPFFALIACGSLASRLRLLPENAIAALNTFVLYFALPCMMFRFTLETPFAQIINGRVFVAYMTAGLVTLIIFVMTFRFAHMDRAPQAAYPALAASWSNWGYMGFALIPPFLGNEALPVIVAAGMADVFVLLSAALALGGAGGANAREILTGAVMRVVRNPMIWAVVAGAAGSAAGLKLPAAPDQFVRLLGSCAVPVALFAIGVSLYRPGVPVLRAEVMLITGGKLLLHPYIAMLVAAFVFGLSRTEVQVLVLMAALPVAGSVFLFAERAGSESESISGSILVSTALAFLSFSALVWAMGAGFNP
ncbi:MAG: AEC family transporter [Burkholderiales bacterium]